ncbi:hypothetical protein, partial [Streptomyces clavuligerus]|uniref:hypothetical protein n=1 Tax=Streptomyces clavuligerus TaxID=1901 RepID=UPI0027DCA63E
MEAGDILMRRGLTDHAPAALVHVIEAAKALEDFRLGHSTALERAEILLDRAIATFRHGTGEHDEAAWQTAAVHMVELWATRYSPARLTVFDPAPPPPSRLTPAHPLRLETVSREAHRHLLDAGRCLERTACGLGPMDTARGQLPGMAAGQSEGRPATPRRVISGPAARRPDRTSIRRCRWG